jgi:hypothetical protein
MTEPAEGKQMGTQHLQINCASPAVRPARQHNGDGMEAVSFAGAGLLIRLFGQGAFCMRSNYFCHLNRISPMNLCKLHGQGEVLGWHMREVF